MIEALSPIRAAACRLTNSYRLSLICYLYAISRCLPRDALSKNRSLGSGLAVGNNIPTSLDDLNPEHQRKSPSEAHDSAGAEHVTGFTTDPDSLNSEERLL